ncbi:MAG: hypothetical protein HC853_05650 [Anaerolineae bacterium]|nr:hypothetical protein [Anaerolineae bacterium]
MTIIQYLNQFSVFMLPGLLLLVAAVVMVIKRARLVLWLGWMGALLMVVGAVMAQRTPQTANLKLDSVADIRTALASGKPSLVEFYSDY